MVLCRSGISAHLSVALSCIYRHPYETHFSLTDNERGSRTNGSIGPGWWRSVAAAISVALDDFHDYPQNANEVCERRFAPEWSRLPSRDLFVHCGLFSFLLPLSLFLIIKVLECILTFPGVFTRLC